MEVLHAWLATCGRRKANGLFDPQLAQLTSDEEEWLIDLVRGLGRLEVVLELLEVLAGARPTSQATQEAYTEALLARAKQLLERCEWTQAEQLLRPLAREHSVAKTTQVALLNLLGCCACVSQDSETGQEYFRDALKLSPSDPRLHQNMALAFELQNRLPDAEPHWNRYFDLLDNRLPGPSGQADYFKEIGYVGLCRLAGKFAEKEKWANAIPYQQRALRLRPRDGDTMERLFHLYAHAKRQDDARRILRQLQELRPGEPQYQLFELDLIEVSGIKDVDYLLGEVERIHERYPNDPRVEDKAVSMVGNVIPLMGNLCDQLTDQLNRVLGQVRRLPNYQINWSSVYDVMADLQREFHKLRRITNRCLPLLHHEEQRRVVRNLAEHIDRKIDVCRSVRA
jgi:tetratricopeptide (TPR) repeat protein